MCYHPAHFAAKWGLKLAFLVKGEYINLTFVDYMESLKVYFKFDARENTIYFLIANIL